MLKYIIFILIGIFIYKYLNDINKFLIPFTLRDIITCKSTTCREFGDCEEQCYATMMYNDDTMYDELQTMKMSQPSVLEWESFLQRILSRKYSIEIPQNFPLPYDEFSSLPPTTWLSNKSQVQESLIDIFSSIPIVKGENNGNFRLVFIGIEDNNYSEEYKYRFHYVIFGRYYEIFRSEFDDDREVDSIYMLDSKHRVINKNRDILNHPWFNMDFYYNEKPGATESYQESFDWSSDDFKNMRLFFFPITNEDGSDINPEKDEDNLLIELLLTIEDGTLDVDENRVFRDWIRRTETGIIDPNKLYFPCASDLQYASSGGGYGGVGGGGYSGGGYGGGAVAPPRIGLDSNGNSNSNLDDELNRGLIEEAISNGDIRIGDVSEDDLDLDIEGIELYTYREEDESIYLTFVPISRRSEIENTNLEILYSERDDGFRYVG